MPSHHTAEDARRRAAFIRGLHNMAAFFATHLDVPPPDTVSALYITTGTPAGRRNRVDQIARVLGEPTTKRLHGQYLTRRDFGGGVSYEAVALPGEVPDIKPLPSAAAAAGAANFGGRA